MYTSWLFEIETVASNTYNFILKFNNMKLLKSIIIVFLISSYFCFDLTNLFGSNSNSEETRKKKNTELASKVQEIKEKLPSKSKKEHKEEAIKSDEKVDPDSDSDKEENQDQSGLFGFMPRFNFPSFDFGGFGSSMSSFMNNFGGKGKSFSTSRSFVYSNVNGKENKQYSGADYETKISEKKGEGKVVDKFARKFLKKNDDPTKIVKRGASTDEEKNLILGDKNEEKELNLDEEQKEFANDRFFNAFTSIGAKSKKNKSAKSIVPFGVDSFDSFNNDPFDEFFEMKKKSLINKAKTNTKKIEQ